MIKGIAKVQIKAGQELEIVGVNKKIGMYWLAPTNKAGMVFGVAMTHAARNDVVYVETK